MDGARFDEISRRLAARVSRRGVMSGAGAGLLAALGLRAGPAATAQVSQAQCGNVSCRNNPGKCAPGCVCCVYGNGSARCGPPGSCGSGTAVCPVGLVVDPVLGCVQCRSAADCPAPGGPCQLTTCVAGVCGTAPVADGAPGACPAATGECTVNACNAATGGCELRNLPNTTTCAGDRVCQDGVCPPLSATTPCAQPSDLCQFNARNPETLTCVTVSSCFPDACEEVTFCNYIVGETNRANINCSYGPRSFGACDQPGGCPAGTTCCGGQCRNLACDPTNCGECGYNCITRENPNGSDRFDRGNACAAGRCFQRPNEARKPVI